MPYCLNQTTSFLPWHVAMACGLLLFGKRNKQEKPAIFHDISYYPRHVAMAWRPEPSAYRNYRVWIKWRMYYTLRKSFVKDIFQEKELFINIASISPKRWLAHKRLMAEEKRNSLSLSFLQPYATGGVIKLAYIKEAIIPKSQCLYFHISLDRS